MKILLDKPTNSDLVSATFCMHPDKYCVVKDKQGNTMEVCDDCSLRWTMKLYKATDVQIEEAITAMKVKKEGTSTAKLLGKTNNVNAKNKNVGKTLHLKVTPTWIHVFAENEKNHLTDEGITSFMKKEFPTKPPSNFEYVPRFRRHYNDGLLTHGIKPKVMSQSYNKDAHTEKTKSKIKS